ncbi:MAG: hypothetical protein NZ951_06760 [Dehalococcoidia bacterium]|nr:hypothetical protein [Dehalococcoidia bacterium]MDW8120556.1 hypothetical protein [Chloroflexota bacterium]
MDDAEFLRRLQERIERSTGRSIALEVDYDHPGRIAVELDKPIPRVVIGSHALKYPGLARMFMQYAILALRRGRPVEEQEFLLYLRRN